MFKLLDYLSDDDEEEAPSFVQYKVIVFVNSSDEIVQPTCTSDFPKFGGGGSLVMDWDTYFKLPSTPNLNERCVIIGGQDIWAEECAHFSEMEKFKEELENGEHRHATFLITSLKGLDETLDLLGFGVDSVELWTVPVTGSSSKQNAADVLKRRGFEVVDGSIPKTFILPESFCPKLELRRSTNVILT